MPLWFAFAAFAGLALRIALVLQYARSPFAHEALGDEHYYWIWAGEITSGRWRPADVFYQAPLYPYLLAVAKIIRPQFSQVALAAGQVILNWLTCLLLVPLVTAWTGRSRALAAAALALFFSPAIFFALKGLPTTTGLFLFVASLAVVCTGTGRKRFRAAVGGALAGLSLLAVPSFLFAFPGFMIAAARAVPLRGRGTVMLTLAIAASIVILPVSLHNYRADGSFALISANSGMTFADGNGPRAAGTYAGIPGVSSLAAQARLDGERIVSRELGRPASQGEVSRFFFRYGFSFIRGQPGRWLLLELRKTGYLLAGLDVPLEFSLVRERRDFLPLLWAFGLNGTVVMLLALVALSSPVCFRSLRTPLLIGALLGSVGLVFYVSGRYVYPAYFFLIPAAAAGLEALLARRWRWLMAVPVVVIGAALAFARPALSGPAWECDDYLAKLAGVYDRQGRPHEALATYQRWMQIAPDSPFLFRRLGEFYLRNGQPEDAEGYARHFLALAPGDPMAGRLLARVLVATGRAGEAVPVLEGFVVSGGADTATLLLLADIYQQLGRREDVRAAVEEAARQDPFSEESRRRLELLQKR